MKIVKYDYGASQAISRSTCYYLYVVRLDQISIEPEDFLKGKINLENNNDEIGI